MSIQILEIKKVDNGGALQAFAKIKLGEIICCDFRIVQQPGQRAWVSVPQVSWTDNEGKTHYKNLVELSKNLKDDVFKMILGAWSN